MANQVFSGQGPGNADQKVLYDAWLESTEAKVAGTTTQQWQERARALKRDTLALYLAARHPGTPWYAKILVVCVAAYALSPIDLIPDFIPVLGYLDDMVLLPLGIALALRLVPPAVIDECRARAAEAFAAGRPVSKSAAAVVVVLWVAALALSVIVTGRLLWSPSGNAPQRAAAPLRP